MKRKYLPGLLIINFSCEGSDAESSTQRKIQTVGLSFPFADPTLTAGTTPLTDHTKLLLQS